MEAELLEAEGAGATTCASVGVQLEEGRQEPIIDPGGRNPFEAHPLAFEAPGEASQLTDEGPRGPGAPVGERQLHAWARDGVDDAGSGGQGPRGPVRIDAADKQRGADDLDRYRSGNPIQARRTPVWERGWKWSKRRPGQAMAVAGGLLLFIGLIVGSIVYLDWKNNQVVQLQNRGLNLLARADRANDRDELEQAEFELSQFLKDVKDQPKLEPIALQVGERRKRVVDQLHLLQERAAQAARDQAAKERDLQDRSRFQNFLELREDAQLYAAVTGVLLSSDHLEKFRASAHQALAIYAQDPRSRR